MQSANMSDIIIIDLKGVYNCPKLYARKVWEALFRAVDAGPLFLSFDNFLIDYECFSDRIDNALTLYYEKEISTHSFYWEYEEKGHFTKIYDADYPEFGISPPFFKITFDIKEQKIILIQYKDSPTA